MAGFGFDDEFYDDDDQYYGEFDADTLYGDSDDDLFYAYDGDDALYGDAGLDTAVFDGTYLDYRIGWADDTAILVGPDGHDRLVDVEQLWFDDSPDGVLTFDLLQAEGRVEPLVAYTRAGVADYALPELYVGPVGYLDYQFLGLGLAEVVVATPEDDFLNLLAGDDAADGGFGDDVLDGGLGSNFLTGGGGADVFFLDGRGEGVTWGTITDWAAGEELSIWGWQPGISQGLWVEHAGATGYGGATFHGDLEGDGIFDISVTWAGRSRAELPVAVEYDGLLWFA